MASNRGIVVPGAITATCLYTRLLQKVKAMRKRIANGNANG